MTLRSNMLGRRYDCSPLARNLFLWLLLALCFGFSAKGAERSVYDFKAAYLYHFAQLVTWPESAFQNPDSPLVIAVLGRNPFGDKLALSIRGKQINGRPIEIRECSKVEEAAQSHLLFISESEASRLPQILAYLKDKPVLTVSETSQFIDAGGAINFYLRDRKIRFEINNEAAKSAGLKISSRLLVLSSKEVAQGGG
jgi:hypothetical protein